MKKHELRTGHKVVTAKGYTYIVLLDAVSVRNELKDILINLTDHSGYMYLSSYDEDLKMKDRDSNDYDIVKVSESKFLSNMLNINSHYLKERWKRPEKEIEISVKVNGEDVPLSSISEETLIRLRKEN